MNQGFSETDQPPRLSRRDSLIAAARGAVLAVLGAGAVFLARRGGSTSSCSAGSSAVCARCRQADYCVLAPAREYRKAIGHAQQHSGLQPGGALGKNATDGRSPHGRAALTESEALPALKER